jgi:adenine-specific DNA-methyltransferase
MDKKPSAQKQIADLTHPEATRKNIPTMEHQSVMARDEKAPVKVTYPRGGTGLEEEKGQRNPDLDPQLVWRGKDRQDWSDLVVNAPPLYIQEKVKPKALIDDLRRYPPSPSGRGVGGEGGGEGAQIDLFGDFNGLPEGADRTEFYQHEGHWQNRMILGDSLQVMASLAEREGLRGKVQCVYFDPPYGIKFNSNFQWSTASRDVKDGNPGHITREPEQVKAFRDTWRDGIHSYLTYLRDRLTVARDLLTESGSIFVQIGDENVHRVRAVMDEVFGDENFVSQIRFKTSSGFESNFLSNVHDYVIWYTKKKSEAKYHQLHSGKLTGADSYFDLVQFPNGEVQKVNGTDNLPEGAKYIYNQPLISSGDSENLSYAIEHCRRVYHCGANRHWKTSKAGMERLLMADRIHSSAATLKFKRFHEDYPVAVINNQWNDTVSLISRNYVVETNPKVIERCILMASDPGDLVLDPTCGSGTTAYVAEQWGRRWITIDTSRVALALARARIMGARYPYYLLADSRDGQQKEAEVTRAAPSSHPTYGNIAHGFVYERVPHITLKSIANNTEIDVIWDKWQPKIQAAIQSIEAARFSKGAPPLSNLAHTRGEGPLQEWQIPREKPAAWPAAAEKPLADFWAARIARQKEMDASIAARAEFEFLYDKPYEDKKKVRVAGPFTVESLSPHRMLGVDEEGGMLDPVGKDRAESGQDFTAMILDNLKTAGVQQAHKADKIEFTSLTPWAGEGYVAAVGEYLENGQPKRAGIFVGPEFGTVSRADLVEAAREAGETNLDVLISCAFNYEAPASEFGKLGRIRILKARMNADLHMAQDLKNTGKGNLFVIFGEPDVDVLDSQGQNIRRYDGKKDVITLPEGEELRVRINGVDVFHPATGEVVSDGADGIACWFLDTNYDEESFFVRHAYFLGASDPYKALKTTLKAEIDPDAWATLHSDTSRPFPKPATGRFAVKVINHLGDEVMKVFKVIG